MVVRGFSRLEGREERGRVLWGLNSELEFSGFGCEGW